MSIKVRAPLRVSFAGGGTDLPLFYQREEGHVLSCAIDKYVTVTLSESSDGKWNVDVFGSQGTYSSIEQIPDPVVSLALKELDLIHPMNITFSSELKGRAGLGSSGAMLVGMLYAIGRYKGLEYSRKEVAEEACRIEINLMNRPVGKQDQYISCYGGAREFVFHRDGETDVKDIECPDGFIEKLLSRCLLIPAGKRQRACKILGQVQENLLKDDKIYRQMQNIKGLVPNFSSGFRNGNIEDIGLNLSQSWDFKRRTSEAISSDQLDALYRKLTDKGISGGKILGAGGGGYFLVVGSQDVIDSIANDNSWEVIRIGLSKKGVSLVN
jgi:D-glycero-alpha-D-manno-heptose-7-phosphate kinase